MGVFYTLHLYPYVYACKVVGVTWIMVSLRDPYDDLKSQRRGIGVAIAVGLFIFWQWVWLHEWLQQWWPWIQMGERTAYNPFAELYGWQRWAFLSFRLYGLVLMVPVMEELFWRSFLLRYFSRPDFTRMPMDAFTWSAFGIVSIAFGLAHNEWFVAILCGMAYALLLKATSNLWACIIAHATTNLALGVYILTTQAWSYW